MADHQVYMQRCFDLALLAKNKVKSNPNVGAVIVYKDNIIGEGYHKEYGQAHAEVNALASVNPSDRHLLKDATLYVSLEPCCIDSKTPPCTNAIIKSGIKKVVVSTSDPHQPMRGKGLKILEDEGIKVIHGILQKKGDQLIKPFAANLSKRPYIIIKFAQSKDGYFGKRGQRVQLSNKYSQVLVHKWRSEIDGILIGYHTAMIDNPMLTTRVHPGTNPIRIVIDLKLELPRNLLVWTNENPTYFVTNTNYNQQLPPNKFLIYQESEELNLGHLMSQLFDIGINRLLVEGGAKTINHFINHKLWDEARIITNNTPLGKGIRAPRISGYPYQEEQVIYDKISYIYNHN